MIALAGKQRDEAWELHPVAGRVWVVDSWHSWAGTELQPWEAE